MAYTALYREFRPKTFGEMVGQEHITKTLKKGYKIKISFDYNDMKNIDYLLNSISEVSRRKAVEQSAFHSFFGYT